MRKLPHCAPGAAARAAVRPHRVVLTGNEFRGRGPFVVSAARGLSRVAALRRMLEFITDDPFSDDAIREAFDGLEEALNGAQYLSTGNVLSLTDVVWFPTVRRVFLCGYDLRRHPSLWAWHERMRTHSAIAPFVEPMGGLGNAFYAWQYLTGTSVESFVAAHRRARPFRLEV